MTAEPVDMGGRRRSTAPGRPETVVDEDFDLSATRGRYHVPRVVLSDPAPPPRPFGIPVPRGIPSARREQRLAEVYQARLFIGLLLEERAELMLQLAVNGRGHPVAGPTASTNLAALRARIDEVTRLLDALSARFPTA